MKIAIIGYGAMGKMIEGLARKRGHEVTAVIDEESAGTETDVLAGRLAGAEVAIDFSVASAVLRNTEACMAAGVPLVEGTTGWHQELGEVRSAVEFGGGAFVYGANFSIGGSSQNIPRNRFYLLPYGNLLGQNVTGSSNSLNVTHERRA